LVGFVLGLASLSLKIWPSEPGAEAPLQITPSVEAYAVSVSISWLLKRAGDVNTVLLDLANSWTFANPFSKVSGMTIWSDLNVI
jgi:hypothetical protein